MAASTVRVGIFKHGEFDIVVSFKIMRSIRYRMSPLSDSIVEMSVPHLMSDTEVRKLLEEIYPGIKRLAAKTKRLDSNTVTAPDTESFHQWRRKLDVLIPLIEDEMGLKGNKYALRFMTSRWGSCSPSRRNISLNSCLARMSEECTHYVIVHELCHLVHPDHSPAFWRHVERYFPDYRRVRAYLRTRRIK